MDDEKDTAECFYVAVRVFGQAFSLPLLRDGQRCVWRRLG